MNGEPLLADHGAPFRLVVPHWYAVASVKWLKRIDVLTEPYAGEPWLLTHKLVARRDLLPGAVITPAGLVVLMFISSYVMELWINLYARDYGGFGVALAIYFWILFSSAVIVWAASLSPALAERRDVRRAERDGRLQVFSTGATGLEPATSGVTGRRSNQLNYAPRNEGV